MQPPVKKMINIPQTDTGLANNISQWPASRGIKPRKNAMGGWNKSIGIVTAEVVGLHVEQCKRVSWHRPLYASQGLPPAAAVQQGCSCAAL